ncbi:hypothetical protein K449DRAFT_405452 [Hypoxylon sp. EC38]|nr:hypothetical protein K449DRAFT_405452 [Hypoxylon sp. EC38]
MKVQKKRLFILCDGTWQDGVNNKSRLTNVATLARCLSPVDHKNCLQLVYYDNGIGNGTSKVAEAIDGATGRGISAKIRNAYSFIAHNYNFKSLGTDEADEIVLVGFSRGAFAVQCLASFISQTGLVHLHLPPRPLAFVGKEVPGIVQNAFQALALDERRRKFKPQVWKSKEEGVESVKQCWFLGTHADVGGNGDAALGAVTLLWMLGQLRTAQVGVAIERSEVEKHLRHKLLEWDFDPGSRDLISMEVHFTVRLALARGQRCVLLGKWNTVFQYNRVEWKLGTKAISECKLGAETTQYHPCGGLDEYGWLQNWSGQQYEDDLTERSVFAQELQNLVMKGGVARGALSAFAKMLKEDMQFDDAGRLAPLVAYRPLSLSSKREKKKR